MRTTGTSRRGKNFDFIFYGDWDRFANGVRYLSSDLLMDDVVDDLERLGHQIAYSVKNHIMKQDLNWPKLSKITIYKKGGREEILIDSMKYANSITSDVKRKWKHFAELTVWPEGNVDDRDISYQQLAFYHEYGTKRMPERPLWRPVMEEIDSMEAFKALQSMDYLLTAMIPSSK
jgi:hypothetical protein